MSSIVDKINSIATFEDVARDFVSTKQKGVSIVADCPFCHAKDGLVITPGKKIFKCFHCNKGGNSLINFVMMVGDKSFAEAIDYFTRKYSIFTETKPTPKPAKKSKSAQTDCFMSRQLRESGLTTDDVLASVLIDDKNIDRSPFSYGSLDNYWRLRIHEGDDMLIWYFDLEGKPVQYTPKDSKTPRDFFRIRFQNPAERKDKFGREIKYYSPAGSGTHIYIPERIRKAFKTRTTIKRLYIQEGEKKAEKATKHGLPSVGIMGIHNIGSNNLMPHDLQRIIMECGVTEVVLVLDADWQNLHRDIKIGDNVHQRPLSFFHAIKSFKEYMLTLRNVGINLEIYFAAGTSKTDKGIDDLLTNTLRETPEALLADFDSAINNKSGLGQHVEVHKITAATDQNLRDYFLLNDTQAFATRHIEILKHVPEFTMFKNKFRIDENNNLVLAEPLAANEKFWDVDDKGRITFNYENCYTFLMNRGYYRLRMLGSAYFVNFKNQIVEFVDRTDIKDYVRGITKEVASQAVRNMMFAGGHYYLGPHSLENLDLVYPVFEQSSKNTQSMHFTECFWQISADSITSHLPITRKAAVWANKIKAQAVQLIEQPLISFTLDDPRFTVSPEGANCHFLQFLINTCNFTWRGSKPGERVPYDQQTPENQENMTQHLLSKLTALGYLTHRFYNAAVAKAVICMDAKNSEVGASNGRTGKSLFGIAVTNIVPTNYIGGKSSRLTEDPFLFEEVTEETEVVFFDDVRANIDFEYFFPNITGRWTINKKGIGRFTLPSEKSPKMIFSTNHAINGDTSSFKDRQHIIAFSDYYNEDHKPTDDFPLLFFDEWDNVQWNLFYNLVAVSLQLYFRHGLYPAPAGDIKLRQLRQFMGEDFITWAEEFFSPEGQQTNEGFNAVMNLNRDISRSELYNSFLESNKRSIRYMTPTKFGKSIRWFCQYKGYHFNPMQPNKFGQNIFDFISKTGGKESFIGEANKSGGVEYFQVSNTIAISNDEKPF
jgi:DNA primase